MTETLPLPDADARAHSARLEALIREEIEAKFLRDETPEPVQAAIRSLIAVAACSSATVHSLRAHRSPTCCWALPIMAAGFLLALFIKQLPMRTGSAHAERMKELAAESAAG